MRCLIDKEKRAMLSAPRASKLNCEFLRLFLCRREAQHILCIGGWVRVRHD